MRIDAHQHFWSYDPVEYGWIDDSMAALRRDFLPGDLEPELASAGFEGCVAVQARQTHEETRWLLALAHRHPFIVGVVGWADLRSPDARAELQRLTADPRLVGLRHVVQSEPDDRFLLRPEFLRGVALLEEFRLAYDILIHPRHLPVAAEFVERFPAQRFVLDHLAKPEIRRGEIRTWARDLRRLAASPNVFAKLSGLVTEASWKTWTAQSLRPYLDVAFECFGASRLMIGSDWPVCTVAGAYARVMGAVKEYLEGHLGAQQEAVLGTNATWFWGLDRQDRRAEETR